MRQALALLLAFAALAVSSAASSFAATPATTSYIVVLQNTVSPTTSAAKVGVVPTYTYTAALHGYAADLTATQLSQVRAEPGVSYVARNRVFRATGWIQRPAAVTPGSEAAQDPQIVSNFIRRTQDDLSPTAHIDGEPNRMPVDIAILDTGIDSHHPDLNVVGGVDCLKHSRGYEDADGHGTMVAGFAAAKDNAIGRVGEAPGARLWSVRVLDKNGNGSDAAILCGLDWVARHAHTIDVANMSFAGPGSDTRDCGQIKGQRDPAHEAICRAVAKGVTFVAAAGNASSNVRTSVPAAYPQVIAVSAFTDTDGLPGGLGPVASCLPGYLDDTFAAFSNFGRKIAISAPGVCMTSTYPGGLYAMGSGTSFASPIVAGAAAIYRASHPQATPAQVRTALIGHEQPGPITGDPDNSPEGIVDAAGW